MMHTLKPLNIDLIDAFYSKNKTVITHFSIYFSLSTELIIPILIVVKRTRHIGIVIGMAFHFTLALEGLGAMVSFTSMMFMYLMLISAEDFTTKLITAIKKKQQVLFNLCSHSINYN